MLSAIDNCKKVLFAKTKKYKKSVNFKATKMTELCDLQKEHYSKNLLFERKLNCKKTVIFKKRKK